MDISKHIIAVKSTAKEAYRMLNLLSGKEPLVLFVEDDKKRVVGSITDGDIRRGIVRESFQLNDSVNNFMNPNFEYLEAETDYFEEFNNLKKKRISFLPVLNLNKEILHIYDFSKLKAILPIEAIIIAGGEGKRLRPLTNEVPKPLLNIGDKPIIEHLIRRFNYFGISKITISINYLGDQLVKYFNANLNLNTKIDFIRESTPLGTLGSVSLMESFECDDVLVVNSDILTDIDLSDFYKFYKDSSADMAVATVPYKVNVPYAVLETSDASIISFSEKPTYTSK